MSANSVVIAREFPHSPAQMLLAENDQMIKTCSSDQFPDLRIEPRPPFFLTFSGPMSPTAFPVPANDCFRLDDVRFVSPSRPHCRNQNPKGPIGWGELRPNALLFQDRQLLSQQEILGGQVTASLKQ